MPTRSVNTMRQQLLRTKHTCIPAGSAWVASGCYAVTGIRQSATSRGGKKFHQLISYIPYVPSAVKSHLYK
eukprot:1136754-Pelagomonas_calceolata.AAC.2